MTAHISHPEWIELEMNEVEALLARVKTALGEEDHRKLAALVNSLRYLRGLVEDEQITMRALRELLFGPKSEKTRQVMARAGLDREGAQVESASGSVGEQAQKKKRKGHGRHGAEAYPGAEKIAVPHGALKPGDACPGCAKGKVYAQANPGVLVRIRGEAPLGARVYELEKLRCHLCGEMYTARAPEGVGEEKYNATAASMIGLMKYGSGLPLHRLERLQKGLGIPLPTSTQWEIVADAARSLAPVHEQLIREAAQGEVVHNDDTTMTVLALKKGAGRKAGGEEPSSELPAKRTGVFTSGIVSTREGRKIALFFTGRQHAGENLADVLSERASELGPPIQMCDALAQNVTPELDRIVANCLVHGRRNFVKVVGSFPEECRHVLEVLREVYRNDAMARERGLSPEERLRLHQAESGPVMEELESWLAAQLEERRVEPNSGLGKAINYLQAHWEELTLFLREPGAPLDNNICERALKKAILHRKNALFYKTENGARVGDLYMSLIHTCELAGVSPFDYLTELLRHKKALAEAPGEWLPWNYQETLAGTRAAGG